MRAAAFLIICLLSISMQRLPQDVHDLVEHRYANNGPVKIHYVTAGKGPVIIMLHGFPDYWYTWRYQIALLSKSYRVVAVDLRGYNLSDKPKGVEHYAMRILMQDVLAVMDDLATEKAILLSNDWGGAIAWQLAMYHPHRVRGLIACNIPHPAGIQQYLSEHPSAADYAREFKQPDAAAKLTVEGLVGVHEDLTESEKERYRMAFESSDFEAMLNYYTANYPTPAIQKAEPVQASQPVKQVQCPVLMIHGMLDKALPAGMLNNTWDWVDNNVTLHTIPDGKHFIQQHRPDQVNRFIVDWLNIL